MKIAIWRGRVIGIWFSNVVVTIHQPEHLPWLGLFDKIRQADVFVVLDNVQYRKRYFQNRNKIMAKNGPVWLTVPVLTKGKTKQTILEVQIDNVGSPRWREKCWSSMVQCYQSAPFWEEYQTFFQNLYAIDWDSLSQLNESIINFALKSLSIEVDVLKSSQLNAEGCRSDLMLNICKEINADTYLSGISGKEYLDLEIFSDAEIKVIFQKFHHPVYQQLHKPFIPCLSVVDLLFMAGPKSLDVIEGVGVETMDKLFT